MDILEYQWILIENDTLWNLTYSKGIFFVFLAFQRLSLLQGLQFFKGREYRILLRTTSKFFPIPLDMPLLLAAADASSLTISLSPSRR